MAKRRYGMDTAKISRFREEGRGDGHGVDYKPWLTVQDISSSGRSSRVWGWKTNRLHHFFSDHETRLFLLYQWFDAVTDIREQFPLDQERTLAIAESMGIAHPAEPTTRTPIVMTTDFLLDLTIAGRSCLIARAVKPSSELSKPRVIEKLELERRYWVSQGIDWGIVTEQEIPVEFARNIAWANEMRVLEPPSGMAITYWPLRSTRFLELLAMQPALSILGFLKRLEMNEGFAAHEGLTVLRHLIAHKSVIMDMSRKLEMVGSLSQLTVQTSGIVSRRSA